VQAAAEVAAETAALPAHVRADALDHVSRSLADRADEIAGVITAESGKPLKWSRVEVSRAVSTFRWPPRRRAASRRRCSAWTPTRAASAGPR